jgi:hypothetical protein
VKWSERIQAVKDIPVTAQRVGNLLAFTLGVAIAAFFLATIAMFKGVNYAH